MSTKTSVNRDLVLHVGGQILAAQLAGQRDPAAIDAGHLDTLADMSVRAALALDAAIPRAEERLAAEAKAAEAEVKAAEDAAKAAALADAEKAKAASEAAKPKPVEAAKAAG